MWFCLINVHFIVYLQLLIKYKLHKTLNIAQWLRILIEVSFKKILLMSLPEVCVQAATCLCLCVREYVIVPQGLVYLETRIWTEAENFLNVFPCLLPDELIVLDLFLYIVLISAVGRQSMMMENHNCPQKHIITHWPERTPCSLRRWIKLIVSTEMLRYYCTWMIEWNGSNENMNERINQWLAQACALAAYKCQSSRCFFTILYIYALIELKF